MGGFAKLGIKAREHKGGGDKIHIDRIFGREIYITGYEIGPSKFEGKALKLYFTMGGMEYITINGSENLMEMVAQVPKDEFPLKTSIVKKGLMYTFT